MDAGNGVPQFVHSINCPTLQCKTQLLAGCRIGMSYLRIFREVLVQNYDSQ
jgi:hypothetical protein